MIAVVAGMTASSAASSRDGDHVHAADGFVAIRDIAPAAETHLLVLPERHVDTFREIDAFPDEEAGRMLRFVAAVAAAEGLEDYRVIVNVGAGGGPDGVPPPLARPRRESASRVPLSANTGQTVTVQLIATIEDELKQARLARDDDRRDALTLILASLRSAEKELQRPLSEDEELQVLQSERKKRARHSRRSRPPAGRSRPTRRTSSSRCSRSSCRSRSPRTSSTRSSTT